MSEQIVDTIVWGYVRVQGNNYMLLSERPITSVPVWQKPDTLRWLVACAGAEDADYYKDDNGTYLQVYTPLYLIFGTNAVLEYNPNPTRTIKVKNQVPEYEVAVASI